MGRFIERPCDKCNGSGEIFKTKLAEGEQLLRESGKVNVFWVACYICNGNGVTEILDTETGKVHRPGEI